MLLVGRGADVEAKSSSGQVILSVSVCLSLSLSLARSLSLLLSASLHTHICRFDAEAKSSSGQVMAFHTVGCEGFVGVFRDQIGTT